MAIEVQERNSCDISYDPLKKTFIQRSEKV